MMNMASLLAKVNALRGLQVKSGEELSPTGCCAIRVDAVRVG